MVLLVMLLAGLLLVGGSIRMALRWVCLVECRVVTSIMRRRLGVVSTVLLSRGLLGVLL